MSEGERVVRGGVPATEMVLGFLKSSVGAKVVMALTGAALWGFVIIHLLGNLQIFLGPEAINQYGVDLRAIFHGAGVWAARAGLLLAFVVHIVMGVRLAALNRKARGPVAYGKKRSLRTSLPALSMASTGLLILTFLFFHLAHFTFGGVDAAAFAQTDEQGRHDIFKMVWIAFKQPWLILVYVVGQSLLLAHLFHGTQSLWQSLGFFHSTWTAVLALSGRALAGLIFAGNVAIPLVIYFVWGAP